MIFWNVIETYGIVVDCAGIHGMDGESYVYISLSAAMWRGLIWNWFLLAYICAELVYQHIEA